MREEREGKRKKEKERKKREREERGERREERGERREKRERERKKREKRRNLDLILEFLQQHGAEHELDTENILFLHHSSQDLNIKGYPLGEKRERKREREEREREERERKKIFLREEKR